MLEGDLRIKYGMARSNTNTPNFINGIQVAGTALSTAELAKLDGVTAGTVTASKALVVGASKEIGSLGTITLADAANIVVNATTGTKIGTATTQKIGFYNVTPVVQPASANQAAVGAVTTVGSNTGTAGAGLSLIGDTTSVNQAAAIMNDLVALQEDIAATITLVNQMRSDLIALGLIKGSA